MNKNNWPFSDPENTAVFTTSHILDGGAVLFVAHDAQDGSWQFHDGIPPTLEDSKVVSLNEIVILDPSLLELSDLPLGYIAQRQSKNSPWVRVPLSH